MYFIPTQVETYLNQNFVFHINYMENITAAIRSWNPWWIEEILEKTWIPRRLVPDLLQTLQTSHIKDILGIRRSGKTTLLHQIIHHLISEGTPATEILFIAFDDPILISSPFDHILDTARYLFPKIRFLFIDEIHEKKGWELWLKKIYDTKQFSQIFISGSNTALLSDEVGKALTGRHLSFFLTPFTFPEYLDAVKWTNFGDDFLKANLPHLLHEFDRFLVWGGFPETLFLNESLKRQVLIHLYNDVLARDISTRISINFGKIRDLTTYLMTNFTREFSNNKIAKALGLHSDTLTHYLHLLENALMIKLVSRFSFKLKMQFRQNKKVYVVDNGLRNAVSFHTTQDRGKYAENLVCMELFRRNKKVFYWKDDKHEVDFVVRHEGRIEEFIQVCWDLSNAATRKREYAGLLAACRLYKLSQGLILNRNEDRTEQYEEITIRIRPLALWLVDI